MEQDLRRRAGRRAATGRRRAGPARRPSTGSSPGRPTTSSGSPRRPPSGSGPPCSPAARAPARRRPWPASWRCSPSRPSSPGTPRCGSRWPHRPARPRRGWRRRSATRWPHRLAATDTERLGDLRAVTLHRLLGTRPDSASALPPRPRQPAAARRRGRRRDVDGVADDDGPAAGGGAAREPGWCWSATPISWPPSRPVRCWPTSSTGSVAGGHAGVAALRTSTGSAAEIGELALAVREAGPTTVARPAARRAASGGVRRAGRPARRAAAGAAAATRSTCARRRGRRRGRGAGALERHRLLCAHREGPGASTSGTGTVERWLSRGDRATRCGTPGTSAGRCW